LVALHRAINDHPPPYSIGWARLLVGPEEQLGDQHARAGAEGLDQGGLVSLALAVGVLQRLKNGRFAFLRLARAVIEEPLSHFLITPE
jgi:hypothetical protein